MASIQRPRVASCSGSTTGPFIRVSNTSVMSARRSLRSPFQWKGAVAAMPPVRSCVRRISSLPALLRNFQIRPSWVPSGWQEAQAIDEPELAWKMA